MSSWRVSAGSGRGGEGLLWLRMTHTEIDISAEFVRDLLRDQHPDLADRPVRLGARGWDNQLWRLGDDLAVRLPWATEGADELLLKEHTWVPALAPRLPLPVPVPQRLGEPSARFPRRWIVTTWVPGEPADRAPVTRGAVSADALAAFLTALHQPAPEEVDTGGRGRGGPLSGSSEWVEKQIADAVERELISEGDAEDVRAVWDDAATAPDWAGPPLWLHGDLHAANVVTADGALCGVIDFGDLFAGDPACDLSAAWTLLPDGAAERCFAAYGHALDAATMRRARGWVVIRGLAGLHIGDAGVHGRPGGKATWGPAGRAALRRVLAAARR